MGLAWPLTGSQTTLPFAPNDTVLYCTVLSLYLLANRYSYHVQCRTVTFVCPAQSHLSKDPPSHAHKLMLISLLFIVDSSRPSIRSPKSLQTTVVVCA